MKTFAKGSGCYTCTCCGRKTRDDGNGDSVHCKMCTECYEMAGLENLESDTGQDCSNEIEELKAIVRSKGGRI